MRSGVSGVSEATSRALESRQLVRLSPSGGSDITVASTCSMWFWTTSRMAPVRS